MKTLLSQREGILDTLLQASDAPIGLRVSAPGVRFKTLRQWFYVTIKRHEPRFDHLVLVNMHGELWIVRSDSQELKNGPVLGTLGKENDESDRWPV